ncbi:hypothetical protein BC940DRAFT_349360 [Gongronella butleri]|nr:hypothetical protein BC940DRAFT_349360 [Gongronella butleri]
MLDKVLLRLKEEIAMDGYQGTPLSDVWEYTQRFVSAQVQQDQEHVAIAPVVDEAFKQFFWPCLTQVSGLAFFPEQQLEVIDRQMKAIVEANNNNKGKDDKVEVQLDYQLIHGLDALRYDEVKAAYGDALRVVADKDLQDAQLFVGVPIGQSFSINLRNFLTSILHSREHGVTQAALTNIWGTDPRSTGYYVAELEKRGAITRTYISVVGSRTNLCVHSRFKDVNMQQIVINHDLRPSNTNMNGVVFNKEYFVEQVILLLKDAKDYVMTYFDLMKAMGFDLSRRTSRSWFNRTLDLMCLNGTLQKLAVLINGKRMRCVKLLRVETEPSNTMMLKYADDEDVDDDDDGDMTNFDALQPYVMHPDLNGAAPPGRLIHGVSTENQMRAHIEESGETGLTLKEINAKLRCDYQRMPARCLERVLSFKGDEHLCYGLERVLEFVGRNRRYRYYTPAAYNLVQTKAPLELPDYTITFVPDATEPEKDPRVREAPSGIRKVGGVKGKRGPQKNPLRNKRPLKSKPRGQGKGKGKGKGKRGKETDTSDSGDEMEPEEEEQESEQEAPVPSTSNAPDHASEASNSPKLPIAPIFTRSRQSTPAPDAESPPPRAKRGRPRKKTRIAPDSDLEEPAPPSAKPAAVDSVPGEPANVDSEPMEPVAAVEATTLPAKKTHGKRQAPSSDTGAPPAKKRRERAATRAAKGAITNYFQRTEALEASDASPPEEIVPPAPTSDASSAIAAPEVEHEAIVTESSKKDKGKARETAPMHDAAMVEVPSAHGTPSPAAETMTEEPDVDLVPVKEEAVAMDEAAEVAAPTKPRAVPDLNKRTLNVRYRSSLTLERILQHSNAAQMKSPGRREKSKFANASMEKRKQVILALFESRKIIEHNSEFRDLFLKKRTELFGETSDTSLVDLKTLLRTCQELEKEGKVYIVQGEIMHLNGVKAKRKIIVDSSLDPESDEVRHYFEFINERKVVLQHSSKSHRVEDVQAGVETIEARIERMEQMLADALQAGRTIEASRIGTELERIRQNVGLANTTYDVYQRRSQSSWLDNAQQFGYVNSRMIRSKLLHMHMMTVLNKKDPDNDGENGENGDNGTNHDARVLATTDILRQMTVGLWCQAVGITRPTPEFVQFTTDEANLDKTFDNLPESIRNCMFGAESRFRARLRALFDALEYLGLVEPQFGPAEMAKVDSERDKSSFIATYYRLRNKATIINYRRPERPVLREHILESATDALIYWSDLQFVCTVAELDVGESDTLFMDGISEKGCEIIRSIYTLKNWSTSTVFTPEQNRMLATYIDREKRTTPYPSLAWCKEIADELNLTVERVRNYYRKPHYAFKKERRTPAEFHVDRKPQRLYGLGSLEITAQLEKQTEAAYRTRRARAPRIRTNAAMYRRNAQRLTIHQAKEYSKQLFFGPNASKSPAASSSHTATAPSSPSSELYRDNERDVPQLKPDEVETYIKQVRAPRAVWTEEDEDLLKLSYAILHHRSSQGSRIVLKPIQDVLPDYNINQIRNRYANVLNRRKDAEDLKIIASKWARYYREGCQLGILQEWKHVPDTEVDLASCIAYYLQRMQEEDDHGLPIYPLPADIENIEKYYEIRDNESLALTSVYPEDDYHHEDAYSKKHRAICDRPFILRSANPLAFDFAPLSASLADTDSDGRLLELVKVYIKMVLLTPYNDFDPYYALATLKTFPDHLYGLAKKYFRDNGLIIRSRLLNPEVERRLPGTLMTFSEKFMKALILQLPENIMLQAREFDRHIMSTICDPINPVIISSGMMMSILDLVSSDKLAANMVDEEGVRSTFEKPHHAARRIRERWTNYEMQLNVTEQRDMPLDQLAPKMDAFVDTIDPVMNKLEQVKEMDLAVKESTCSDTVKRLATKVAYLLSQAEEKGLTILDMHTTLASEMLYTGDDLVAAVQLFTDTTPPLVLRVGFDSVRLVLAMYIQFWAILPDRVPVPSVDSVLAMTVFRKPRRRTTTTKALPMEPATTMEPANATTTNKDDAMDTTADNEDQDQDEDHEPEDEEDESTRQKALVTEYMERQSSLADVRKKVVLPRLWNDINGNRVASIWHGCVELVVELLVERPGISFGSLCRHFSATLLPIELTDILQELTRRGAIRQFSLAVDTTHAPGMNNSLFKSSTCIQSLPPNTCDQGMQTSYWLNPGFYHHVY